MKLIKNTEWKTVEVNGDDVEIPVDWDNDLLTTFLDFQEGPGILAKDFRKSGVPLLRISSIKDVETTLKGCNFLSEEMVEKKWAHFKLKENDILLSASGTLGIVSRVKKEHENAIIYTGIIRFRRKSGTSQNYIPYLLMSGFVLNKLRKDAYRSILSHFGPKDLKELELFMPPVPQQPIIASILSKQEQFIADTESLLSKLEKRMKWFSNELLSGRLRVKEVNGKTVLYKNTEWKTVEVNGEDVEIPVDWEVSSFYNKLNFTNGCAFKPSEWSKSGTPIIRIQNLSNKEKEINYYSGNKKGTVAIKNGDFLFAWSGTIDIFKYEGPNAILNQHIFLLTKKENNCIDYFVKCLKKHIRFMDAHGLGMKHITLEEIKRYNFIHSSSEIEQSSIAAILSKQEEQIDTYKQQLKKEQSKFKWLMNNLLSGKYLVQE